MLGNTEDHSAVLGGTSYMTESISPCTSADPRVGETTGCVGSFATGYSPAVGSTLPSSSFHDGFGVKSEGGIDFCFTRLAHSLSMFSLPAPNVTDSRAAALAQIRADLVAFADVAKRAAVECPTCAPLANILWSEVTLELARLQPETREAAELSECRMAELATCAAQGIQMLEAALGNEHVRPNSQVLDTRSFECAGPCQAAPLEMPAPGSLLRRRSFCQAGNDLGLGSPGTPVLVARKDVGANWRQLSCPRTWQSLAASSPEFKFTSETSGTITPNDVNASFSYSRPDTSSSSFESQHESAVSRSGAKTHLNASTVTEPIASRASALMPECASPQVAPRAPSTWSSPAALSSSSGGRPARSDIGASPARSDVAQMFSNVAASMQQTLSEIRATKRAKAMGKSTGLCFQAPEVHESSEPHAAPSIRAVHARTAARAAHAELCGPFRGTSADAVVAGGA